MSIGVEQLATMRNPVSEFGVAVHNAGLRGLTRSARFVAD
jgi:hypothetical protein